MELPNYDSWKTTEPDYLQTDEDEWTPIDEVVPMTIEQLEDELHLMREELSGLDDDEELDLAEKEKWQNAMIKHIIYLENEIVKRGYSD